GEAMTNSIQNGDQPLPVIAQVSLAENAQNAPPTLKDPKFWTAEEKKLERLIVFNETAKDLWDALERQMRGSEYGKQDRKAAILYEYDTFKATKGEQLLDTYLHYLQVINDLKKWGYKKDNCDVNDALGYKKKAVVITSDLLALVAEKMKVSKRKEKVVVSLDSKGSGADDFSELKKITALLAKAFNRRKFYSKPTNNNLRTSFTSQSNGDQPLPVIAQVSLAGNAHNAPPTLKDPKFRTAEEKKTRKIDREQLLDTYLHYLQVINDLKKCGYKKDNCNVNDALGYKKKDVVVTLDPLAIVAEKTKVSNRKEKVEVQTESEGSDDEDISDLKKITA
nr:hypothetical protein [Tanacetum cinerariifolium]